MRNVSKKEFEQNHGRKHMPVSSVRNDVYLKKLYIIIYTTCDPKQKSWICIKYLEKKKKQFSQMVVSWWFPMIVSKKSPDSVESEVCPLISFIFRQRDSKTSSIRSCQAKLPIGVSSTILARFATGRWLRVDCILQSEQKKNKETAAEMCFHHMKCWQVYCNIFPLTKVAL